MGSQAGLENVVLSKENVVRDPHSNIASVLAKKFLDRAVAVNDGVADLEKRLVSGVGTIVDYIPGGPAVKRFARRTVNHLKRRPFAAYFTMINAQSLSTWAVNYGVTTTAGVAAFAATRNPWIASAVMTLPGHVMHLLSLQPFSEVYKAAYSDLYYDNSKLNRDLATKIIPTHIGLNLLTGLLGITSRALLIEHSGNIPEAVVMSYSNFLAGKPGLALSFCAQTVMFRYLVERPLIKREEAANVDEKPLPVTYQTLNS